MLAVSGEALVLVKRVGLVGASAWLRGRRRDSCATLEPVAEAVELEGLGKGRVVAVGGAGDFVPAVVAPGEGLATVGAKSGAGLGHICAAGQGVVVVGVGANDGVVRGGVAFGDQEVALGLKGVGGGSGRALATGEEGTVVGIVTVGEGARLGRGDGGEAPGVVVAETALVLAGGAVEQVVASEAAERVVSPLLHAGKGTAEVTHVLLGELEGGGVVAKLPLVLVRAEALGERGGSGKAVVGPGVAWIGGGVVLVSDGIETAVGIISIGGDYAAGPGALGEAEGGVVLVVRA